MLIFDIENGLIKPRQSAQTPEQDRFNGGGLNWCVEHWDTKWSVEEVELAIVSLAGGSRTFSSSSINTLSNLKAQEAPQRTKKDLLLRRKSPHIM